MKTEALYQTINAESSENLENLSNSTVYEDAVAYLRVLAETRFFVSVMLVVSVWFLRGFCVVSKTKFVLYIWFFFRMTVACFALQINTFSTLFDPLLASFRPQ